MLSKIIRVIAKANCKGQKIRKEILYVITYFVVVINRKLLALNGKCQEALHF